MNSSNLHQPYSPLSVYIPKSIISISKSPTPEKWASALENEINSLISQNVFDTSPFDLSMIDKTLNIPSRVIFDSRLNADGTIHKYKARLVAQGNHHDNSTFVDTFADTGSAKSINILLSIAAENYEMASIDIKTAFLYSSLKETVYLKRPPGLSLTIMPPVVKLNNVKHGLRQAAHRFYPIQNIVDDILCLSISMDLINWFRSALANQFSITIKINVDSFLGMQIFRQIIQNNLFIST